MSRGSRALWRPAESRGKSVVSTEVVVTKKVAIVVVALVLFAGVGYFTASNVWGFPLFGGESEPPNEESVPSVMVTLGQTMTNLSDSNRYIRVTIDLEIASDRTEIFTQKTSELKTDVFALLRSKSYKELSGEEGLRAVQEEIKTRFNAKLEGAVRNVYFSEFIIQ